MLIAASIEERNSIKDTVLTVSNPDGTWTVYQPGDAIPAQYQYAVSEADNGVGG